MTESSRASRAHVLVVSPVPATLTLLPDHLAQAGYLVSIAHHASEVLGAITPGRWDVALIELPVPAERVELVHILGQRDPNLARIILGSESEPEQIVAGLRAGAYDWLLSAAPAALVVAAVARAHERRILQRRLEAGAPVDTLPALAHAINNQLAGIAGLTQLHLSDETLPAELRADFELILQSARSVNDLLEAALGRG